MSEPEILSPARHDYRPGEGMIKLTHLIYALHAISVITPPKVMEAVVEEAEVGSTPGERHGPQHRAGWRDSSTCS